VSWVVDETGATRAYVTAEKGHAQGFVVCYSLEGADEVGAFEVLYIKLIVVLLVKEENKTYLRLVCPLIAQLIH
jgi:hypothetical protein